MADDPTQSAASTSFMNRVEVGTELADIRESVLTEAVWTLASFYKVPRGEIAEKLAAIMEFRGVRTPNKRVLVTALARYGSTRADFLDCLLASPAPQRRAQVITFDSTDFKALGASWRAPG